MALKQVLKLSVPELIQRFEREIRYMKEIKHPNSIQFIDSGITKEGPYLVMEFASQGNLDDLIINSQEGFLSVHEAVPYIIDSLKALAFIHQKDIIHRDLKPENILLQGNNSEGLRPLFDRHLFEFRYLLLLLSKLVPFVQIDRVYFVGYRSVPAIVTTHHVLQ